jgi:rSAM/selenodomain-associated transferase 2
MKVSIIIPTWNEGPRLPHTVAAVQDSQQPHEVLVVDAESDDDTAEVAVRLGCKLVPAKRRQRAGQLNLGAANAAGQGLLFLHADTILPPGALPLISEALSRTGVVGGCFARRFDSKSPFLWATSRLADFRAHLGWFLGDQAIFVRRDVFDRLNGFKDQPLFEDLEFSRRLRGIGDTVCLRPPVRSSARRFFRLGPVRTTAIDVWLTIRYLSGASPEHLAVCASRWFIRDSSEESAGFPRSVGDRGQGPRPPNHAGL